ncbi:hypothetical protein ACQ3HE_19200 [Plantibacter auratus]|uniref:hypothetical protein n=1 Tax=Plantibacter auratus TaxID=272914 RepID=UPI003D33FFE6
MIDPGTGAIVGASVASLTALVVGLSGARMNRRTALDAQRGGERAKALVRVLHIVEMNGQGVQDRIFNLTQARQKNDLGRDPVTHEPDDPYAPHQRAARALSAKELAEAAALLAAYGSGDIDPVHKRWITALDRIEDEYVNSEFRYWERQERAVPNDFAAVLQDERNLRAELGSRVRQVLEDGRVRRFRRL